MASLTVLAQGAPSSSPPLTTASQTVSGTSDGYAELTNTLKILSISFMACLFSIAIVACLCLFCKPACHQQTRRLIQHKEHCCSAIISPEQCPGQEPTRPNGEAQPEGQQTPLELPYATFPLGTRSTESTIDLSIATITHRELPLPPSRPLWDRSLDVFLSGRRERHRQSMISEFFNFANSTQHPARASSDILPRKLKRSAVRFSLVEMERQSRDSRTSVPQERESSFSGGQRSSVVTVDSAPSRMSTQRTSLAQSLVPWWERVHDTGSTITLPSWAMDSFQAENRSTLRSGSLALPFIGPPEWWLETSSPSVPAHFA